MKRYEDILIEIHFFPAEDIVCASPAFEPDLDNVGDMPAGLPFLSGG